jgi:hypothetical protein
LETPRCSIFAINRGSAASDDEVEKIIRNSRLRERISLDDVHPDHHVKQSSEDYHDENDAGEIERGHQGEEADDGLDAGGTDNGGNATERAHGGQPHDHDQDAENQSPRCPMLCGSADRPAPFSAGRIPLPGDQQRLQDVSGG